jgi:hypothetical protein
MHLGGLSLILRTPKAAMATAKTIRTNTLEGTITYAM